MAFFRLHPLLQQPVNYVGKARGDSAKYSSKFQMHLQCLLFVDIQNWTLLQRVTIIRGMNDLSQIPSRAITSSHFAKGQQVDGRPIGLLR